MHPPSRIDPSATRLLANAHRRGVVAFLKGMIDGAVPLTDPSLYVKLAPWFTTYEGDAEVEALLERAATVYSGAAMEAAQECFAKMICDAARDGTLGELREDFKACDDGDEDQ